MYYFIMYIIYIYTCTYNKKVYEQNIKQQANYCLLKSTQSANIRNARSITPTRIVPYVNMEIIKVHHLVNDTRHPYNTKTVKN